jgi:uncharacterized protein YbjQ (UPF0145 family)
MTDLQDAALPEAAMRRLAELGDRQGAIFTSDLSVNEFLLVKEAGFHPVGLVLGSSIYHVGLQVGRWSKNQELTTLTQALYHARELAMSRMVAEAAALGADGIVGVRLTLEQKEFGSNVTEFIAIGTAVKAEGSRTQTQWRTRTGSPFTSDLNGQDFWTLLQSGHAPLGLVLGTCVYHIAHRGLGNVMATAGQNAELPQYTQALYEARELAMGRMQAEAEKLGAEGIVGVVLDSHNHTWGGHTTEFLAIGTAVRPYAVDHVIAPPTMVIGLDR